MTSHHDQTAAQAWVDRALALLGADAPDAPHQISRGVVRMDVNGHGYTGMLPPEWLPQTQWGRFWDARPATLAAARQTAAQIVAEGQDEAMHRSDEVVRPGDLIPVAGGWGRVVRVEPYSADELDARDLVEGARVWTVPAVAEEAADADAAEAATRAEMERLDTQFQEPKIIRGDWNTLLHTRAEAPEAGDVTVVESPHASAPTEIVGVEAHLRLEGGVVTVAAWTVPFVAPAYWHIWTTTAPEAVAAAEAIISR